MKGLPPMVSPLSSRSLIVGVPGRGEEGREPVQAREHLVGDLARLDLARPADHRRHAEGAFPVRVLLAAERRRRGVRPGELVGAVVGAVDDDGVVGDLEIVERLQELPDVPIMLEHPIGVFVAGHAALAAHRRAHVGEDVHARGVHPDEERLTRLHLPLHEVDGGGRGFVVDRLHALAGQRAGILGLAVSVAVQHAARRVGLGVCRVLLRPVRAFGLLLGVQMVEVAEEFVEAVVGRQELVPVTQMVLAELAGSVAQGFQRFGDSDVARLEAYRRALGCRPSTGRCVWASDR